MLIDKYKHLFNNNETSEEEYITVEKDNLIAQQHMIAQLYGSLRIAQHQIDSERRLRKSMWVSGMWMGVAISGIAKLIVMLLGYNDAIIGTVLNLCLIILSIVFIIKDIRAWRKVQKQPFEEIHIKLRKMDEN